MLFATNLIIYLASQPRHNAYSIPDRRTVLYHPDADTANLYQRGYGKIAVSAAGDLTSHTLTADRYMVMNKLKNTSGTMQIVPDRVSDSNIGLAYQ